MPSVPHPDQRSRVSSSRPGGTQTRDADAGRWQRSPTGNRAGAGRRIHPGGDQGQPGRDRRRQATSSNAQMFTVDPGRSDVATLAFYKFYLTLRPVNKLAKVATVLAAGESVAIQPTRRRDELGQLTTALAAWQRASRRTLSTAYAKEARAAAASAVLPLVRVGAAGGGDRGADIGDDGDVSQHGGARAALPTPSRTRWGLSQAGLSRRERTSSGRMWTPWPRATVLRQWRHGFVTSWGSSS